MDTVDQFRQDCKARRGWLGKVAKGTGISPKTLRKWLFYPHRDPRSSYVDKLRAFYAEQDSLDGSGKR